MSGDIRDLSALRALYRDPNDLVANAHADRLDGLCRRFIELSPLVMVGSRGGEDGVDMSPRGGPPGFVAVLDDRTLAIPDRPGNNKIETMTNLTRDPSVGLMFVIPGIDEVLRLRGRAAISADPAIMARLAGGEGVPKTALVVTVERVFPHCGKAFRRARLWDPDSRRDPKADRVPTLGQIAVAMARPEGVDAATVDGKVAQDYAAVDAARTRD